MALESVNALLIVVSVVSSILGIVGTVRAARHDRILRAWAYAILATASVGKVDAASWSTSPAPLSPIPCGATFVKPTARWTAFADPGIISSIVDIEHQ